MPSKKAQKIDLMADGYPCPCSRQGRLQPIVLTEALGCNKCQKIFAVEENGYLLQQVSTSSPYNKLWYWTGKRWVSASSHLREYYFTLGLLVISIVPIVLLSLYLIFSRSGSSITLWILIPFAVVLFLTLMKWLVYRRSS